MVDELSRLDLKNILDILKEDGSTCNVRCEKVKVYDISASEFLSFARQDLEEDSERGRINAVGNAKRAIECRADEILTFSNLKSFSSQHRRGLPDKLLVLRELGVVAPPVLTRYIASKRNMLEHEYVRPNPEETRNLIGITELFLSATNKYVEKGYVSSASIIAYRYEEQQKINRTRQRVIGIENEYKLEFDLKNGAVTITGQRFVTDTEYHKDGHKVSKRPMDETYVSNIAIADCKETDIRDLMKLIWEKAL